MQQPRGSSVEWTAYCARLAKWIPYQPAENAKIEQAWLARRAFVDVIVSNFSFRIDFHTMRQKGITGTTRPVQRSVSAETAPQQNLFGKMTSVGGRTSPGPRNSLQHNHGHQVCHGHQPAEGQHHQNAPNGGGPSGGGHPGYLVTTAPNKSQNFYGDQQGQTHFPDQTGPSGGNLVSCGKAPSTTTPHRVGASPIERPPPKNNLGGLAPRQDPEGGTQPRLVPERQYNKPQEQYKTSGHTSSRLTLEARSHCKDDLKEYRDGYPTQRIKKNANGNYAFFAGKGKMQPENIFLEDLLTWKGNHRQLERSHTYIQWLFPIREQGLNRQADPLMPHEIELMKNDPVIIDRVTRGFEMMLDFYGFQLDRERAIITRAPVYEKQFYNLNTSGHNYLRITRMLKFLGEMGLEHYKVAWLDIFYKEIYLTKALKACQSSYERYWIGTIFSDELRVAFGRRIKDGGDFTVPKRARLPGNATW